MKTLPVILSKFYSSNRGNAASNSGGLLLLVIVVFAAIILIVNPVREVLTIGDDWAYARTVQHLLNTGQYRLDSWAAANMPVQIYLAAGLARIFGYSITLLRLSSLVLFLLGTIAFYQLLYDLGSDHTAAAALTLAFGCSPVLLFLAMTFMSDVPFLAWVLIACWLYARGLRLGNTWALLLGGLAAALAIGTRQFGIALPTGLVFSWIVSRRENRLRFSLILAGAGPPCLAFLWQLWMAREQPTFTQSVRLLEQWRFLHQSLPSILLQLIWRCTVIIEYLGLYLCALLPGLLFLIYKSRQRSDALGDSKGTPQLYSRWTVALLLILLIVGQVLPVPLWNSISVEYFRAYLIPSIPWLVRFVIPNKAIPFRLVLTALGLASAVLLGALLLRAFNHKATWRRRDATVLFFIGTAAAFSALHLVYVQLNDTYLIVFVPFVLMAVAQLIKGRAVPIASIYAVAVCAAIIGVAVAVWLRGSFNQQEAAWHACDQLSAAGIDTAQIGSGCYPWPEYHSVFDEWLTQLGPRTRPQDFPFRFHGSFQSWVAERDKTAKYVIVASNIVPKLEGYVVIGDVRYRSILFHRRFVYILERQPPKQAIVPP